jgi:CHASE2 domain-containing sensor protein
MRVSLRLASLVLFSARNLWNALLCAVFATCVFGSPQGQAQPSRANAQAVAPAASRAEATLSAPFALVVIDEASEKKFGEFPIDRALIAKAIGVLADANAKAVVLKFFYDQPSKNPVSDAALANAMKRTKVLLQARIDDNEPMPNALPDRFVFNAPAGKVAVGGVSGWVPLPMFSSLANHIGFVDVQTYDRVPAYERYLDRNVKSLTVVALQAALNDAPLVVRPGKEIVIGNKRIDVDDSNQIVLSRDAPKQLASTRAISFADLLEGKVGKDLLANRVVVITYDGKKTNAVKTPYGEMKPHMIFWMGLLDAWSQLR